MLARELEKKFDTSRFNAERLMRTEMARVQTEAQKQSYDRNGVEYFEFVTNSGCCDVCKAMNGKVYPVGKLTPGLNAPPLHPHCRCSTAPWVDSEEYEAWLSYLEQGGTTKTWDAFKEQYIKAVYPKGYKDDRQIGETITSEQLAEFEKVATANGVQIGSANFAKEHGGFAEYRGDYKLLMETLNGLIEAKKLAPVGSKPVVLCYDYVKDSSGRVDVETFAMTKGRTITLNKHLYDSMDLKDVYKAEADSGFFVKGSTYKNICIHEYGHILSRNNAALSRNVIDILRKNAYNEGVKDHEYIKANISEYGSFYGEDGFGEVLPELLSMLFTENGEFALSILRKAGLKI